MAEMNPAGAVTLLLGRIAAGDRGAEEELFPHVYTQLRRLAASHLRHERQGHTLQPTALVHEAYLRLAGQAATYQDRKHFFAVAARVMRNILVDHAKKRAALKRGSGQATASLDRVLAAGEAGFDRMLEIDDLLQQLARIDERQARIVELRFFAGLTEEEISLLLGVSERTVKRDWVVAKAWFGAAMSGRSKPGGNRLARPEPA